MISSQKPTTDVQRPTTASVNELDLLSIGDSSLDVFVTPTESETLCQLNDKEELICFAYGDKIPVKNLEFSIGGNAANNAVGATRLGVKVAVVLTLGEDEIGDQIINKLIKEEVDTSFVSRQEGPSNYSTAITVAGERTLFTYKAPRKYQFPDQLPKTPWVYLTSMGDGFEEVYARVVEHIKNNPEIKLAYNPGSRQLRASVEKSKGVLAASYIVYVNRKEAEMFTGMKGTQGKEKELLKALSNLGPKVPIVTDGSNGSFVYDGEKFSKAGILPVDSYERTGAGDSFGSGCVSALIKGKSIKEALLWGTVNSASVIGYAGAQRGLLTKDQMSKWLERARSSEVEVNEL